MFVEVVMLQKISLFVGHPLVSATLVIASFLAFAGIGSARVGRRIVQARWPGWIVAGLVAGYAWFCGPVFDWCGGLGLGWRMAVTVTMLAPLATWMGMMFPIGLMSVRPADVPWAWAVNGCFSVTGATLASVLSMDIGFTTVLMCGALLYAVAGLVGRRL
jgi:hypothetical protein